MKVLLALCLIVSIRVCTAQKVTKDFLLIGQKEKGQSTQKVEFKGVLKFYSSIVSEQILNDCVYEYSCSEFSQGAFNEYGLFKGLVMTCDRLTRCNRATLVETSRFLITKDGRIKEHWHEYEKPD